jgi:lipopolysaccharide exporter
MTIKPPIEDTKPKIEPIHQQNTSFKGDIIRLVAGSGFAQVIAIIALPIITRFYTPAHFGIAAIFASICGILGVLACMRYELSIVLPDNDREAANLLALSLLFSFLMGLVLVVLIFTIGPELLNLINMSELTPYMWLFPIVVMIQGIYAALNYWTTRTKHFMKITVSRVSSQLVSTSITLGTGISGYASGGAMIIASTSGQAVASVMLIGQVWRDIRSFLYIVVGLHF